LRSLPSLISLFLIIYLILIFPQLAFASVSSDLQKYLLSGRIVHKRDLNVIETELASNQSDPFTRMVAGEVLCGLGYYALGADQYSAADSLKPDYVLVEFKKLFELNAFVPALLFLYLQDKYPKDPAVLLYAARRNLSAPTFDRGEQIKAVTTARKELDMAAALPQPWPGTHALIAMMEFNDKKLDSAIRYADLELAKNPNEPLAEKVKIMALDRLGTQRPGFQNDNLTQMLEKALSKNPNDDVLNLMLGRAYSSAGNYKKALVPALTGLLQQHDPNTLHDGRAQVFELMKKLNETEFLVALNQVCLKYADPGSGLNGRGFKPAMLRIRVAELFSMSGKHEEALVQYKEAQYMSRRVAASAAYHLGKEQAFLHRYQDAMESLDLACRLNANPENTVKYEATTQRIKEVYANSGRNLALKLKASFSDN
jgi:hypothetical protein